jgi:single-strand DNA-binding protein
MPALNRVFLIGNLTRDPELRYTPKGTPVAEIGVAVNRTWTDESGEKREEVVFIDAVLWGRLSEVAQRFLTKGSPVFVEGRLQLDTWDDKQTGQKRSRLRVVAENLQLLGSRDSSPERARERQREDNRRLAVASAPTPGSTPVPPPPRGVPEPDLDDAPF